MYKTVLITGASRGIGRAIACAFAREGCRLIINCSRSEKELLALADELRETCHVDVLTSIGDVSDYAYMEQLLYSFKRRAKILTALEDTKLLFRQGESRLYNGIEYAVEHIQSAQSDGNIYQEAFSEIEKEYGCK